MKKYLPYIILTVVGFILIADLFHPGYPFTHDGKDHIARIANFYLSLSEGNLIPRWAANLNWGYGHPILMFLYPLPSYLASLFHFFHFSFVDSYKIVLGLGIFSSGITMYMWLSEFLDPYSSTFGAILYMFAPYRMVDAYVRGDIGENLAFVFIPLVLWSLKRLSRHFSIRVLLIGAICLSGVIVSHNAVALMIMPFFILYASIIWMEKKERRFIYAILFLFVLGLGLSAFFWIPGLLEGKYTLRNIVTAGVYRDRFVSFGQLLYGSWNYGQSGQFTLQLGIFQWIGIISGCILLIAGSLKRKMFQEKNLLITLCLFVTAISIFLMLSISNVVWSRVALLQNFQFPWRFLVLCVVTGSVLGAYAFSYIRRWRLSALLICICILFVFQSNYFHAQKYINIPESFFTGIYDGTTDTGESSPIWSTRFMEHRPSAPLQVISGSSLTQTISRSTTKHVYHVIAITQSILLENTVYFPGWHIFIDGKEASIQYQDPAYRGIMEIQVPPGTHTVVAQFLNTKIREVSEILTAMSFILVISLGGLTFLRKKYEKK